MKTRIVLASVAIASVLMAASAMLVAGSEDEKELKPATQVQVEAPTKPQTVTPETKVKGPAAPVASPQIKLPTETGTNPDLQQQALDEKAKAAAKGVVKTRAHPVSASVILGRAYWPGESPVRYFCDSREDSHGVDVRLRYEWRPTGSPQYVRQGFLNVRSIKGEISVPVAFSVGSGEVSTQRRTDADGRLIVPISLTKADVCPSGCTEARLAPPTAAAADRFDQRWIRACLQWE